MDQKPLSRLRGAFKKAVARSKTPLSVALSSVLLATTALQTPLLNSWLGAGIALAGSLYTLINAGEIVVSKIEHRIEQKNVEEWVAGMVLGGLSSVPEFGVAAWSLYHGTNALGLGNVVGANIAHILLVMGATAAIAGIGAAKSTRWKFNAASMIGATAALSAMLAAGTLSPVAGLAMLSLGAGFVAWNFKLAKSEADRRNVSVLSLLHSHGDSGHHHAHNHNHHDHGDNKPPQRYKSLHHCDANHNHAIQDKPRLFPVASPAPQPKWKEPAIWLAGLGGLVASSEIVVRSATMLANHSGLGQAMLGTIFLGVATSATELVVNIKAARRGRTEMAVTNVLTCNVAGALFIGGALSLSGDKVPAAFTLDTPLGLFNLAALGVSTVAMAATLWANKGGIKKWQGCAKVGLYAAYVAGSSLLGNTAQPVKEPVPVQTLHHALLPQNDTTRKIFYG